MWKEEELRSVILRAVLNAACWACGPLSMHTAFICCVLCLHDLFSLYNKATVCFVSLSRNHSSEFSFTVFHLIILSSPSKKNKRPVFAIFLILSFTSATHTSKNTKHKQNNTHAVFWLDMMMSGLSAVFEIWRKMIQNTADLVWTVFEMHEQTGEIGL